MAHETDLEILEQILHVTAEQDVVEVTVDDHVVAVTALSEEVAILTAGVQGPEGIEGPDGPQGIQGDVGEAGEDGTDGEDGEQGPAGTGGAASTAYGILTPSNTWTVVHNLGYRPQLHVEDSSGRVVHGQVEHVSNTTVVIYFSDPFAGTAYIT